MQLECIYSTSSFKESPEYAVLTSTVASLQDQVNALYAEMNSLRSHLASGAVVQQPPTLQAPIIPNRQLPTVPLHLNSTVGPPEVLTTRRSPSTSRPKSSCQTNPATFRGPMSADFNFGVAKNSLEQMGITKQGETGASGSGAAGTGTGEHSPVGTPTSGQLLPYFHRGKDPLWMVPQAEAVRLCQVYEDEMGLMYPVLDIEDVIAYAQQLYPFMEAARRTGLMQQGMPGSDTLDDADTSILKLVIAIGLVVEAGGRSDLAKRLFQSVQSTVDKCLRGSASIKGIQMLAMAVCGNSPN